MSNETVSPDDSLILDSGPSPRGWHRLQLAAECLQKYAWTYEAPEHGGDRFTTSPPLAKGSLIHLALAQHYARMREEQNGGNPDKYCKPHIAVKLIAARDRMTKFVDVALDAYDAYCKEYDYYYEKDMMKIVAVEELVETYIKGKYWLTGRLDLAYEDLGGRLWVLDHKTTSRVTKSHKTYYTMSGQMLGYLHMARERYGADKVAGFKINMIQHTNPKFDRFTLPRSSYLEQKFEQSVEDIEERIARMKETGREYDDWPKAMSELTCVHRYGECDHLSKCRFGKNAKRGGNWTFSMNE